MKAVIEVGANNGRDTRRLLSTYPGVHVFSFEPVPKLFETLKSQIKSPNVTFINAAVGKNSEVLPFNITADLGNMPAHGSSSLYNFRENIQDFWNRPDFVMTDTIDIAVIALEDFIQEHGITEIVHLHCDAQGNDVNVLRGLGKYASIVKTGVIEVTDQLNLYANNENTVEHAMEYFENNGFEVYRKQHNDKLKAELNIWFRRK